MGWFRLCLKATIVLLPWCFRKRVLHYCFGYKIGKGAYIGFSWVFPRELEMKDHARIGHLNVVVHLNRLEIGRFSTFGRGNWITGYEHNGGRFSHRKERNSALIVGDHSAITKSHLIDCTDSVSIGSFSTVAGYRSQIITHGIDISACRQDCSPIVIGDYCLLGTRVVCLAGCGLPDRCVLAAGAVLIKQHSEAEMLYAGVPAVAIKELRSNAGYFSRTTGSVW